MTLSEFKAWFSGFTESMDSTPNEKQWARIKARVDEINDVPTTYPVFIDRYVQPYRPNVPYWNGRGNSGGIMLCSQNHNKMEYATAFDVSAAMADLGKAEYLDS